MAIQQFKYQKHGRPRKAKQDQFRHRFSICTKVHRDT